MSVTAIIPVRNMKDLLPRAIASLREQTIPLREIIVADDGSTDGTYETAQVLADVVIRNPQTDQPWGIVGGRNAAFKRVTTEFTLPIDADDWVEDVFVEKTLSKMREDDKYAIISTDFMYHGEREGVIISGWNQTFETELQANNISVCSLVRTKALEQQVGPWDPNLRAWEDWDLWLRILKQGWKHACVNAPLFHYRLHRSGMNAWANHPDNKQKLYGYLLSKHRDFGMRRL